MGGLRDPRRSVASRLAAIFVGHKMNEIVTKACKDIDDDLDTLGAETKPPTLEAAAANARAMLAEWLGVRTVESGVQHEIIAALAKRKACAFTFAWSLLDSRRYQYRRRSCSACPSPRSHCL